METHTELFFDLSPRLSVLNQDLTVTIIIPKLSIDYLSSLKCKAMLTLDIVFHKEEHDLTTSDSCVNDDVLTFQITNLQLNQFPDNKLLNVSVLSLSLLNGEEKIAEKKFIVQFLKDKGEIYKNII